MGSKLFGRSFFPKRISKLIVSPRGVQSRRRKHFALWFTWVLPSQEETLLRESVGANSFGTKLRSLLRDHLLLREDFRCLCICRWGESPLWETVPANKVQVKSGDEEHSVSVENARIALLRETSHPSRNWCQQLRATSSPRTPPWICLYHHIRAPLKAENNLGRGTGHFGPKR